MASDNPEVSAIRDDAVRKDRIAISLQLEVVGVDLEGRDFVERARTKMVSRTGASIVIGKMLAPEQTVTIKRIGQHPEAEARVIGHLGKEDDGGVYGIALLHAPDNIWGIDFPAGEGDETLSKVLLECPICHTRQIVALNELEVSVLKATRKLSRNCAKCHDVTLWKQSDYAAETAPDSAAASAPPFPPAAPARPACAAPSSANRRKHSRVKMDMKGCVLFGGQETEIQVMDMSRGGVRIQSRRNFASDLLVRIAIPYTRGAANIFVAARVCWSKTLPSGACECGLKYVKG